MASLPPLPNMVTPPIKRPEDDPTRMATPGADTQNQSLGSTGTFHGSLGSLSGGIGAIIGSGNGSLGPSQGATYVPPAPSGGMAINQPTAQYGAGTPTDATGNPIPPTGQIVPSILPGSGERVPITDANGSIIPPTGQVIPSVRSGPGGGPTATVYDPRDPRFHNYSSFGQTREDALLGNRDVTGNVQYGSMGGRQDSLGLVNPNNFNLPGYQQSQAQLQQFIGGAAAQQTPQLGQAALTPAATASGASPYRDQQLQLAQLLGGQAPQVNAGAIGQLPGAAGAIGLGASPYAQQQQQILSFLGQQATGGRSLAAEQVNAQIQQAQQAQAAAAASARPGDSAGAARIAAQQSGLLGAAGATAAGQARLQEQQQAAGLSGQLLGAARGQDVSQLENNRASMLAALGQQAGLQVQQGGMNQAAQLQQNQQLAELLGTGRGQEQQISLANQQAAQQSLLANQQAQNQFGLAQGQMSLQQQQQQQQYIAQLLGLSGQQQQLSQQGGIAYENALNNIYGIHMQAPQPKTPWDYIGAAVPAAAGAIAAASDERLKTDIQTIPDALSALASIRGVTWEWNAASASEGKTPGTDDAGVVAQDVERVLPELVVTNAQGHKMVNYTGMVGVLVQAVKELAAHVRRLEADR